MEGVAAGVLAHVELAQKDGSRLLEVGDDRGVLVGDEVPVNGRAVGGQDTLGVELVLYRNRDAVHRAGVPPGGDVLLRLPCLGQRLVAADGDVGVQLSVNRLDAVQVRFGRLHRRDFPGANQPG